MNSSAPLRDREVLRALFDEVGNELTEIGAQAEIVMVGGSWLLWHTQRAATFDVDSGRRLDGRLVEVARRVSDRRDLARDWLNDHAAAFWPTGASYEDCSVAYRTGGLVVRVPSPEVIFVMKLYRSSPQDYEDMITIWPDCGFTGANHAAEAFRAAYPHAPDDEFLTDHIAGIAAEARTR